MTRKSKRPRKGAAVDQGRIRLQSLQKGTKSKVTMRRKRPRRKNAVDRARTRMQPLEDTESTKQPIRMTNVQDVQRESFLSLETGRFNVFVWFSLLKGFTSLLVRSYVHSSNHNYAPTLSRRLCIKIPLPMLKSNGSTSPRILSKPFQLSPPLLMHPTSY